MYTYNIDYINTEGQLDGTQLNADSIKELGELIEDLKDELGIQQVYAIELTVEEED